MRKPSSLRSLLAVAERLARTCHVGTVCTKKSFRTFLLAMVAPFILILTLAVLAGYRPSGSVLAWERMADGERFSVSPTLAEEVGYQIHSFNDLRQWTALLRHGATWLKTDFYYLPEIFCLLQKRAPKDANGCFLLTHDLPSPFRTDYNTSNDLLHFISHPEIQPWFQGSIRYTIALCFKYSGNCSSESSKHWISLIDTFFESAQQIILKYKLNVRFLLDGSGTPSGRPCIAQRWRPWLATWIVSSDPLEAAFSDNAALAYDRYKFNNMPEAPIGDPAYWLNRMKSVQYGKFLNGSESFLFWEPSNQDTIQAVITSYMQGPRQPAGFRFAINIDPIQFQIYSGNLTGKAINWRMPISGVQPCVAVTMDKAGQLLILLYQKSSGRNMYTVMRKKSDGSFSAEVIDRLLPGTSSPVVGCAAYSLTLVAVQQSGLLVYYDLTNGQLVERFSQVVGAGPSSVSIVNNGSYPLVAVVLSTSQCSLGMAFWSASLLRLTQLYSTCVVSNGTVENTAIAMLPAKEHSVCLNQPSVAVAYTENRKIFMTFACVGSSHFSVVTGGVIGVGSHPSLSLLSSGQQVFLLEAHGDAFCYNTEHHNKAARPAVCDQVPASTSDVLAYNFGLLDDWLENFKVNGKESFITSCNEHLLHGVYDIGSLPTVAVIPGPVDSRQTHSESCSVQAVAIHSGFDGKSTSAETKQCGLPGQHDGFVLDSWCLDVRKPSGL